MKFKSVSKSIFNYSNDKKNNFIKKHVINSLRVFYEYELIFTDNTPNSIDNPRNSINNSYLILTLHKEDNSTQEIYLNINKPYKFENKNIISIEILLFLSPESLISLSILEKPIIFQENTYENSILLKDFVNKVKNQAIPSENNTPTFNTKVACILDEFTYECFSYEVNLLQLKSMTWKKDMESFKAQILLVESAWYGICKTWIGKIACENKLDNTILDLVTYCNKNNIPTVFFNKEGLINFNYFAMSSSIFDYIFVSDENIIPQQKQVCNHDKVYPLSFAAQPKIHNSINKNKYKLGNIAFAGGWYDDKHVDRLNDFEYILKPALNYNVHIYDRNYHQRSMLEFINKYWSDEYLDYIVGRLEYNYMIQAYKNYSLFLNVNSIQNSTYMVSRRVYELLACKTMVLSSYSLGIYSNFKDYIFISKNYEETNNILKNISKNQYLCDKLAKKAQRYVLENHTYKDRLEEIFNIIELNYEKIQLKKIGVIALLTSSDYIDNLYNLLCKQEYSPTFTYILIPKDIATNNINSNDLSLLLSLKNTSYYNYSSLDDIIEILQTIQNSAINIDYFTFFNSKNYYGENYIRDYVNTLSFVQCDVIGKSAIFIFNEKDSTINLISCDKKDSYVNKLYKDTIFFNHKFLQYLINNPQLLYDKCLDNNKFIFYCDDEYNFIYDFYSFNHLTHFNIDYYSI